MSKLKARLDRLLPGKPPPAAAETARAVSQTAADAPTSTDAAPRHVALARADAGTDANPAASGPTDRQAERSLFREDAGTSPRLRSLREQLDALAARRSAREPLASERSTAGSTNVAPNAGDGADRPPSATLRGERGWTSERRQPPLDSRSHRFEATTCERIDSEAALRALGGEMRETPYGRAMVIERRYPVTSTHGHSTLASAARSVDWSRFAGNERLRDFTLDDAVFFDLETTGLSHGAGNLAFLVGVARFRGDELCLYQYFLDDVAHEQAMLALLGEHFEACRHLVTFNGKSFDAHVLHNRQLLNRMQPTLALTARVDEHLDLLHLSRRVFRGVYPDTRLQTLERTELGVVRVEDIPSALIPSTYFHFLQSGAIGPLLSVIEHNRLDVLSMVTLLGRLAALLAAPGECLCTATRLNLVRVLAKARDFGEAFSVARETLRLSADPPEELFAAGYGAGRRAESVDDAALEAWLGEWRARRPDDPDLHAELARHHERRTKDLVRALRHARAAFDLALGYRRVVPPALKRRIERLERRLAP